ncbi:MAG: EscU/YscU/HrcU family type III secretion system export apparatus switch protein [Acidimicrobiales bacterium]|jgi:flagellar biosynthetic protein FlhB
MAPSSEKTEKATPKHRKDMREEGKVALSKELGSWLSLLLVASTLPALGGAAASRITSFMELVFQAMTHPSTAGATGVLSSGLGTFALAAIPIVGLCTVIGVAAAFAQVGFRFTPKALGIKVSRINPLTGFKRTFSSQGLWMLAKTILKLAMLSAVAFATMRRLMGAVLGGNTLPLPTTMATTGATVVVMLRDVGGLALAIAAVDYAFTRKTYQKSLRMTKQQVRDELRRSDGSPEVRRAVRRKARSLSRLRMMAAVASADVVVTNPTHFAVAITYDRQKDRAPRVVAKGADFMALRIRERAIECGIPLVENPLLARTLHASCEVEDLVPPRLYGSVARLLAFVYSLSPTAKAMRSVHQMDSVELRSAS